MLFLHQIHVCLLLNTSSTSQSLCLQIKSDLFCRKSSPGWRVDLSTADQTLVPVNTSFVGGVWSKGKSFYHRISEIM